MAKRKKVSLRAQDPHLARELEKYPNPLPSREFLLECLQAHGAPMMPEALAELLEITTEESEFFRRRLRAMERDGQLMFNRKGALCMLDKLQLISGTVQGHPDGFGFLLPDEGGDDLFLSPKEMRRVFHGDRVAVREIPGGRRREGKIVEVLERKHQQLVGRVLDNHGVWVVVPEDKRITHDILLDPQQDIALSPGQIVTVNLLTQPDKHIQPLGRVVEVLGDYGDAGMEIEIALRKHELPHDFPAPVIAQAATYAKRVLKADRQGREDLRHLPFVTIDGETAKDFDDAVYAEAHGKGFRLLVAIADVSHYVHPNDALDREALLRGNSVYFPRRVIPMLPEALSNGLCSLKPEVDRLCMVCELYLNPQGEIKQYRFYPAVMHSQARLTYTKVAAWLENPQTITEKHQPLLPHLQTLNAVFQCLLKSREQRGAIDFDTTETELVFNRQGKIAKIIPSVRNDAHRLIEECMLAANVCAADFLLRHEQPILFRVHEGPTPEKLEHLREFLKEFSLHLGGGETPSAKDYAQLLQQLRARPDAALLQTVMLRSLQQAQYRPDNQGHFGLAYAAYTHFTSPIRRYPDLLVHRAIKAVLAQQTLSMDNWASLGQHCSATERRADEASRDVLNWLKCYYMQDKVGETFIGTISGVTAFGLFIALDEVYIEGMVHISELGADYFQFDAAKHQLIGERTGQRYRLADRVEIRVARVSLESSKIDFVLANAPPSKERVPTKKEHRREAKAEIAPAKKIKDESPPPTAHKKSNRRRKKKRAH